MGISTAWLTLVCFQAWQHGKKQNKMPEPFYFVGACGVMALAGVVAMANPRLGTMFAWGMVLGAFVSGSMRVVPENTENIAAISRAPGSQDGGIPLGYRRDQYGPQQSGGI